MKLWLNRMEHFNTTEERTLISSDKSIRYLNIYLNNILPLCFIYCYAECRYVGCHQAQYRDAQLRMVHFNTTEEHTLLRFNKRIRQSS